ncbi:hypothetical protein TWF106_007905 [Orbilia oligospora]|uniref:Uncharacterized protein n=1 Tax=Orbilia oligospora TaxID=2813651 RepID=A0A7C8UQ89_ORBOL|nr:hypothetical protein TWF679_011098 [Orbilia oligospora]KAF3217599.1 hypothetical protein TWF106_007905 [Orbilia oligospora]
MSTSPRPEKGGPIQTPTDSNSGISTGVPQGGGLRKHPKATEIEATEAEKARETSRKLVAKKLGAIQKLAELSLEAEAPGTKKARKATTRYISTALDIYDVLGPEFEAVITLKVIRGIESKSLKETVATMMWDKDWKLHNVANILRASADEKLTAAYKLARLEYNFKSAGSRAGRRTNRKMRYLQEAEEILNVLGPDHDEAVALAVVRGIDREELKETVATMMWNKE